MSEQKFQPRLKYVDLAPDGFTRMRAVEHYLNTESGLEPTLTGLVRLLASRLNGCEYCTHLHEAELLKMNETPGRIDDVVDWRGSDRYTHREQAALGWTEAVTNIQQGHAPDAIYEATRAHFTDVETVNLTLTIASINAWNRMAIALGSHSNRG
jgi:AhpD family alkylhydroperoxidase